MNTLRHLVYPACFILIKEIIEAEDAINTGKIKSKKHLQKTCLLKNDNDKKMKMLTDLLAWGIKIFKSFKSCASSKCI